MRSNKDSLSSETFLGFGAWLFAAPRDPETHRRFDCPVGHQGFDRTFPMPWPWSRPDGPAFSATRHPPKNCRGCCRRGPKKTHIKDREETGHEPLGPRRHVLGKTARLGRTCKRTSCSVALGAHPDERTVRALCHPPRAFPARSPESQEELLQRSAEGRRRRF